MKRIVLLVLLLLLLVVPSGVALAQDENDRVITSGETIDNDITLFEGDLFIESGATVNGSVTLLSGDLEVEEGAIVKGNVLLFSGDAIMSGEIDGDLVLVNGDLTTINASSVTGNCILIDGVTSMTGGSSESELTCETTNLDLPGFINSLIEDPVVPTVPPIPTVPPVPTVPGVPPIPTVAPMPTTPDEPTIPHIDHRDRTNDSGFFGTVFGSIFRSIFLGAIAFVVASVAPRHLSQIENTIRQKPIASGTVGLLTAVAVPSLSAILAFISAILLFVCIGILGFPVIFAMLIGLGLASLFGWIALGQMVGQWLVNRMQWKGYSVAGTAALGTAVLTLGIGLLGAIPFFFGEGLVSSILTFVGLGAATLTQLGTKPYPFDSVITENPGKVSAVLETLPVEDPSSLKGN